MTAVAVIAKECVPGRVKTRLHPPFSLEQAAAIAAASLADTLETVGALAADRRILFFDGQNPPDAARGFDIVAQPSGGLDERLASLFDAIDEPLLLVGMDTPQVRAEHVAAFWADLATPTVGDGTRRVDAWFGPASDGGFWALGLRHPDGALLRGVPMSRDDTGSILRERLVAADLRIRDLPVLTDIDTATEVEEVAATIPSSRLAAAHVAALAGDTEAVRA